MATVLDTRRLSRRLRDAGVPEAQAEAVVDTLLEVRDSDLRELVTKSDLKVALAELEARLMREMATFRVELSREIAASRVDIIKWVAGLLIAQAALVAALVRLL
jgi:hypothetical protein